MEYITMCFDRTNKLEHWYVRHNNVYCLHLRATCLIGTTYCEYGNPNFYLN